MSLSKLASLKLQVLLATQEDLCKDFQSPETDFAVLCKELQGHQLIDKLSAGAFCSLDQEKLDSGVKSRYLLQQILKAIKGNPDLFGNFLTVLSVMKMARVCRLLTSKYSSLKNGQQSSGELFEKDLSILIEILGAKCGAKWKKIGILLKLPVALLESIGDSASEVTEKLSRVLTEWMTGKYAPVTLDELQGVLETELVAHKVMAANLKESFEKACTPHSSMKQNIEVEHNFRVLYQSCDLVINDGKAALLEVQTTSDETASYLWMKDGQVLSNGELFSGVDSNILVVYRACEATKGKYTCEINGEPIVNEIVLSVAYSKEKEYLISKYSFLTNRSNDTWPMPTATKYIRLALLKKEGHPSKYFVKSNIEPILQKESESKTNISFEDAFGLYQPGSLILVEGRPGSGKTTFACKITRDWATQSNVIRHADYVFLLPLRGYQKKKSLVRKFKCFLELADKTDGKGFCFIFDGLDEWQDSGEGEDLSISSMIQKDSLEQAMIIIMSRPAATAKYRGVATKRIEILGFSTKEVYNYVDMYPFNEVCTSVDVSKKAYNLKKYLETHRNVLHMCYLPVHAAMICFLYGWNVDMPKTETQIYEHFTKSIILRKLQQKNSSVQLKSLDELDEDCIIHFKNICKLAFSITCKSKQVVESNQDFPVDSLAPPNSLLTIDAIARLYGVDNMYTFLHLTLQEYLAARHITTLSMEEQLEIIQQYASKEHMLITWKFFCGMDSNCKGKATLFEELMKKVKSNHLYKIECAYESQNPELCTKLIQVESSALSFNYLSLTPANCTAIAYVLMRSSVFPSKLDICVSSMVDQDSMGNGDELSCMKYIASASTPHLKINYSSMVSNFQDFISQHMIFLEKFPEINHQNILLKVTNFITSFVGEDNIKSGIGVSDIKGLFGNFLKHSSNSILISEFSKPLIDALQHCAPHFRILNLVGNMLGPDGIAVLSAELKHCSSLESLDISANMIGLEGVRYLADALPHCKALQYLNVSANIIDKEGEEILSAATIDLPNLSSVAIGFNSLNKIAFANHSNLESLFISGTVSGLVFTRENCRFPPNLEILELKDCNMDSNGAPVVAEALKSCTNMRELIIPCNNIEFEGALGIIESVKDSIKKIDFSQNVIGKEEQDCLCNMYGSIEMDFSQNTEPEEAASTDDAKNLIIFAHDFVSYFLSYFQ